MGLFGFCMPSHHPSREAKAETQAGSSWCRGLGKVQFTVLLFMACSARFSSVPKKTWLGVVTPTMGWALPHHSLIKKCLPTLPTAQYSDLWRHFIIGFPSSHMISALCHVDKKHHAIRQVLLPTEPSCLWVLVSLLCIFGLCLLTMRCSSLVKTLGFLSSMMQFYDLSAPVPWMS